MAFVIPEKIIGRQIQQGTLLRAHIQESERSFQFRRKKSQRICADNRLRSYWECITCVKIAAAGNNGPIRRILVIHETGHELFESDPLIDHHPFCEGVANSEVEAQQVLVLIIYFLNFVKI
jgi:hypothetical protein